METILKSPAGCQKSLENIGWQIISSVFASHAMQMLAGIAICLEVWQAELRIAFKHLMLCGFGASTICSAAGFPVNRSSLDELYPWCKMCVQCSKRIANELIVCKYKVNKKSEKLIANKCIRFIIPQYYREVSTCARAFISSRPSALPDAAIGCCLPSTSTCTYCHHELKKTFLYLYTDTLYGDVV